MTVHEAGAACCFGGLCWVGCWEFTEDCLDGFGVDHAGAEDLRGGDREVDDRGFDSDVAGAGIDDEGDFTVQGLDYVGGLGRGGLGGKVGAGGSEGETAFLDDGLHERVGGPAEAHGIAASGDGVRDGGGFGEDQG
ncbi:MAG: hypothetical protein RI897_3139 [Verrucomicrobiota bacterium]